MNEYEIDDKGIVPGVYHNVSFEEYCQWPYVNNSSLGPAIRSSEHYACGLTSPRKDAAHYRFGHLTHTGQLEVMQLMERYIIWPDFETQVLRENEHANLTLPKSKQKAVKAPKQTKRFKELREEFEAEVAPREPVEASEFEAMKRVVVAITQNERADEYFNRGGDVELSIVWDDEATGLRCKARLDHYNEKAKRATDLKTTIDAMGFSRSLQKFGYDRQAAFYSDGCRAVGLDVEEFCFVVVEKDPPYGVLAAPIDQVSVEAGRIKYKQALRNVQRFRNNDIQGYTNPEVFSLPSYELRRFENAFIIRNGKVANEMPNINSMFPSKYLAATDLSENEDYTLKISKVEMEEIDGDAVWVLYFEGKKKGMCLNKTNANTIGEQHGEETDDWLGKEIRIFRTETEFKGKMTPCLRVRTSAVPQTGTGDF